jgi:hypothetical protein
MQHGDPDTRRGACEAFGHEVGSGHGCPCSATTFASTEVLSWGDEMISRLCCFMCLCFTASFLVWSFGAPAAAQDSATQAANEWITVNKDYSSQRYVDLDQINPSNVRALKEVWKLSSTSRAGTTAAFSWSVVPFTQRPCAPPMPSMPRPVKYVGAT